MATRLIARAIIRQAAARTWADARQPERARLVAPGARRRRATLDVTLQRVSDKGMLFESQLHLPVGAHAQLRMRTGDEWSLVEGFVVRCKVAGVGDGPVSYETALQFDDARAVADLEGLIGLPNQGELAVVDPAAMIDPLQN
jgi:NADPH-dependent 2,4-dienoyl-CoA reductase/sulfur reductase-like enzyme